MKQPDLFDHGGYEPPERAPYQRHSDTSKQAAEDIENRLNSLQARVLAFLRSCEDGATDEQMQIALGLNPSTQRPRRIELGRKGLCYDSGDRRKTTSGRLAAVWRAK